LSTPRSSANGCHACARSSIPSADHAAPRAAASLDFDCSPQGIYHKNFDLIGSEFSRLLQEGYTLYILSDSAKQHERLRSIFAERGDKVEFIPVIGTLHAGFVDHRTRSCIFTDHQIFDRFHKYSLKSERARSGKLALSLKELSSIEPGDYIVHSDHGVGRFAGLVRSAGINGRMQEMIKLTYLNGDTIFVSLHSLHKLSKYRGKEGAEPRINKLGSGAWNKRQGAHQVETQGHCARPDIALLPAPPGAGFPIPARRLYAARA